MVSIIPCIVLYSRRENLSLGSSCAQNDVILSHELNMNQVCDIGKKKRKKHQNQTILTLWGTERKAGCSLARLGSYVTDFHSGYQSLRHIWELSGDSTKNKKSGEPTTKEDGLEAQLSSLQLLEVLSFHIAANGWFLNSWHNPSSPQTPTCSLVKTLKNLRKV